MEADPAHRRRYRERHHDAVVERGLVIGMAQRAVEVIVERGQTAEAFDHAGAGEAEQQPVHDEQAGLGGVEKKVDRLGLGDVLVGGEGEGIDAEQRLIIGRADVRLEL